MARLLSASCVALLLSITASAAAQSGAHDLEARALFEAGRVAFIDERYEDALEHFQRAYELSNRPELLYNLAASLDRLDREAESLATFRRYLAALPEAPNHEEVELRIRVLEAHVARAETTTTVVTTTTTTETVADPEIAEIEAELGDETPIEVTGLEEEDGGSETPPPSDGGHSVAEEPWLWIVIGLVVVGAAAGITAGVLVSQDPGYAPYSGGDVTVMTLRGAF